MNGVSTFEWKLFKFRKSAMSTSEWESVVVTATTGAEVDNLTRKLQPPESTYNISHFHDDEIVVPILINNTITVIDDESIPILLDRSETDESVLLESILRHPNCSELLSEFPHLGNSSSVEIYGNFTRANATLCGNATQSPVGDSFYFYEVRKHCMIT